MYLHSSISKDFVSLPCLSTRALLCRCNFALSCEITVIEFQHMIEINSIRILSLQANIEILTVQTLIAGKDHTSI